MRHLLRNRMMTICSNTWATPTEAVPILKFT